MLYLRLAGLAAFAVIVGIALYYRGNSLEASAAQLRAESARNQAVAAVAVANETIDRITRMRAADDKLLLDLAERITELTAVTAETQASVVELERTNEDVRAYLSGSIPDDLRRLLNSR